jgi:hypothetical protein
MKPKRQQVKPGSTRWYRIIDGVIERTTLKPEVVQSDPSWTRGMGPCDRELANEITSQLFKGKQKPPQQREKMRIAKLGKEKSSDHRLAMSQAHILRSREIHKIMSELGCNWNQGCHEYRRRNPR